MLISVAFGTWYQVNITIPSSPGRTLVTVPMNGTTQFTVVYCFGQFNWYIGADGLIPNETSNSLAYTWQDIAGEEGDNQFLSAGWSDTVPANHVFVCISTYSVVCATLQLLVSNSTEEVTAIFPDTSKGLSGRLAPDGESGSISWTKTDLPAATVPDTYEVYYTTSPPPMGYYWGTACTVRGWMTPFNSSQGNVVDNQDGTITANVRSLDPSVPYTLIVISDRYGGYSNPFNAFTLNGDDVITTSTATITTTSTATTTTTSTATVTTGSSLPLSTTGTTSEGSHFTKLGLVLHLFALVICISLA